MYISIVQELLSSRRKHRMKSRSNSVPLKRHKLSRGNRIHRKYGLLSPFDYPELTDHSQGHPNGDDYNIRRIG